MKKYRQVPKGIDSEVALKIKERKMPPEYDNDKACSNPYLEQARNLKSAAAVGNILASPQAVQPYQEDQPLLQRVDRLEKNMDMALHELFSRVERLNAEVAQLKRVIGAK